MIGPKKQLGCGRHYISRMGVGFRRYQVTQTFQYHPRRRDHSPGEEILGVVGFPCDKWAVKNDGTNEAGAKMTGWNVKSGMLRHSIPTSGGMDSQQALIIVKIVLRLTTLKRSIWLTLSKIEGDECYRSPHIWWYGWNFVCPISLGNINALADIVA
jgi:hypothetical protein